MFLIVEYQFFPINFIKNQNVLMSKISKISITFYFRYWKRKGREYHVYPKVSREGIKEIKEFITQLLPVEKIEFREQNGKIYKNASYCRLSGILIELSKAIEINHQDEYELIFKPIDKVIYSRGAAIYNMWGYGEEGGEWQMDGRHARSNEEASNKEDVKLLKENLKRLRKRYKEVEKDLWELAHGYFKY